MAEGADQFSVETRDVMPVHFLIKIQSFSLLATRGILTYESREFEAGDYKWKLIICTEGEHISVELTIAQTDSLPVGWEVNAIFSFFLYNQISDNYVCFRGKVKRFHVMKPKWGLSNLISKETLTNSSNGYIVDDNCVFGAEVFVLKPSQVIEYLSVEKEVESCKRIFEITKFSKLGYVWKSENFSARGFKWRVKLYPNGDGDSKGKHVSIYLICVGLALHQKVKADSCICIKNHLTGCDDISRRGPYSDWFTASELSWGWTEFAPIVDFQRPEEGFVVNDCCILEVEVFVEAIARDAT